MVGSKRCWLRGWLIQIIQGIFGGHVKQLKLGSRSLIANDWVAPHETTTGSNRILADAVRTALRGRSQVATASVFAMALSFSPGASAQTATDGISAKNDDISEIVVTARREAIIKAEERKKNSESMIDSVVADEAGLLPDNSVTEVLQRVSGVTIVRFASLGDPDHFSAEGSGIQVRGLSGVDARLNGREVFSANNTQGLSFGDVTPELLAAVDVYKSATADLIEGGSGGQVDLRTKMPFDYDPGLKFITSANANYGDLAKKVDPGASVLLSDRWTGPFGEFGALLDVAYSKLDQKDNFIRNEPYYKTNIGGTDYYIPGGYDYGFDQFERTRTGVYVGLQWSPTADLHFGETFFYSKYKTTGSGDGAFITSKILAVDPATSKFDSNNILVSSPNVFTRNPGTFTAANASSMYATGDAGVSQSHSDTLDASTTFDWKPAERWNIKGAFQFVNSVSDAKSYDLFDTPPSGSGNYSLSETSSQPNIVLPASIQAMYANPADYFWSAHQDHASHNDGEEHAVNLDATFKISETGFFRSVQLGARYSDRTEQDEDDGYNWSAFCKGWNGCNAVNLASAPTQPGDVTYQTFPNYFRGSVNVPGPLYLPSFGFANTYNPVANVAQLGGSVGAQTNFDGSTILPYTFGPSEVSVERSTDSAGFGMLRFSHDGDVNFDGNIGVRVVKLVNESEGYFIQPAQALIGFVRNPLDRAGGRTTSRALPAFNIRFKPTDQIIIRAAYTVTLDEPSFYDLRANGGDGVQVNTVTVGGVQKITSVTYSSSSGNPELRPLISHNTDLSFEWYPNKSTSADLELFYKKLNDTIVYGNTFQPVPFQTATGPETFLASVSADFNAPQAATIKGFEVDGRTFFDMLPSPFNGLGVGANYTFVDDDSPGNQYVDISGVLHHDTPIVGLSKNSYNAELLFEKTQLSMRLAYNWRSQYLMTTNSNGTNGSYSYFPSAGAAGQNIGISLPIYAAPYGELDFGVTYRPISNLAVALQLNNLTNETAKTLMGGYPGGEELVRSWFTSDRRILLSVTYKLQ
jgi:iron complex outermembrane receptor protein